MNTTTEQITPIQAALYLEKNKINRPLRKHTIETYASEMRGGNWLLTHQGIGFNEKGDLIDGQHRLHAIIKSQMTVEMMVTRGIRDGAGGGEQQLFVIDTIDRGKVRTIGDQLHIRHNVKNSSLVAALCATICRISTRFNVAMSMTVSRTLNVYDIYMNEITHVIENRSDMPGIRSAGVMGSVAFAMKSEPDKIAEFYERLVTCTNLQLGMPAQVLHKLLIRDHFSSARDTIRNWRELFTLSGMKYHVLGEPLRVVKYTTSGLDFWINKQKTNVEVVKSFLN